MKVYLMCKLFDRRFFLFFKYVVLIKAFFALSCTNEKALGVIPSDFAPYVKQFFDEAKNAGINLKMHELDLNMRYGKLDMSDGLCVNYSGIVTIDSVFWKNASETSRLWLIFHELGHCVLKRGHYNDKFSFGECKSIMRGIENGFLCSSNLLSPSWKRYYFNELFSENRILPEWYDLGALPLQAGLSDSIFYFQDTMSDQNDIVVSDLPFLSDKRFQMRLDFANWNKLEECIQFLWDDKGMGICDKGTIEVYRREKLNGQTIRNPYIFINGAEFQTNDSLTTINIEKRDDFYYFFINDILFYIMDFEPVKTSELYVYPFDGVVCFSLKMSKY